MNVFPVLMAHIRKLLPVLSGSLRKGSCGRLAVIGGSEEYTGAPYFAAITALKMGMDMVHVFCAPEASPVIKTYSPDLIVHPKIEADSVLPELSRVDAIVMGPGLGRHPSRKFLVEHILLHAKENSIPTVVDGDALWFVNQLLATCCDMPSVMLTPNKVEFARLCEAALDKANVLDITDVEELRGLADDLSARIGISVFLKGEQDYVVNKDGQNVICDEEGTPRRCGGQGDATSGSLAAFLLWASREFGMCSEAKISAGLASSQLVRWAGRRAFEKEGRAMSTSDLIGQISGILREIDATM